MIPKFDGIGRPASRDAGVQAERHTSHAKPKDPFHPCPIEPASRARVPCPSSTTRMRSLRVDIARNYVGLHLVPLRVRTGVGAVDGVNHAKKLAGLVAIAERCKRNQCPDSGVRVLPTVLADPRQVSLNVTRVMLGMIKGRGEEQD